MGGAETEGKDLGGVSLVDGSVGPGLGGTRGVVGWVELWARWSCAMYRTCLPVDGMAPLPLPSSRCGWGPALRDAAPLCPQQAQAAVRGRTGIC